MLLPLGGCLGSGADDSQQDPVAPGGSLLQHLHDLSIPDPDWAVLKGVVENYRTPIDETFDLDTWVIRPPTDEPVPIVLTVTPYYKGGSPVVLDAVTGQQRHTLGRLAEVLVPRGYAVGVSSVRGTGNSGGCFTQGGPTEAVDTANVIEHLAADSWSNGNVGLIGVSYDGTTPQDVWVEAPPSLKTIVPIAGISDLYKYSYVHGVPINPPFTAYYWAYVGLGVPPYGGFSPTQPQQVPGIIAGEICQDQAETQSGAGSSALDGDKSAYWQERDFLAELLADPAKERAPVFYIHGLGDWNVQTYNMEGWLEAIQATGVPFKAWLGQWPHAWPESTSLTAKCQVNDEGRNANCRNDWWNETLVAWFDQWLKGSDTGIMDTPTVQVQDDQGIWRHEDEWPPKDVEWRTLRLGPGGSLGDVPGEGSASYWDMWAQPCVDGDLGAADLGCHDVPPGGMKGPTSVEFVSDPFAANTTVSGLPRFEGNVTASGRRASLLFTLMEERPDGSRRVLNWGGQSLNHVRSLEQGEDDVSGLRQQVTVLFYPQDDVITAGSRVVLHAAGTTVGSSPRFEPVSDGSVITIDLDGARLLLPVDLTLDVEEPQPYDPRDPATSTPAPRP
jgi:X-Pro dipeptidyl-peptidase